MAVRNRNHQTASGNLTSHMRSHRTPTGSDDFPAFTPAEAVLVFATPEDAMLS